MKKNIILSIVFLAAYTFASAQSNELIGQYYLTMPAYNPAHTGADDFLNITAGFRQQWSGFGGSPSNTFLSAYGAIQKHGADSSAQTLPKHGIGGYVMDNAQGSFKQNEIALMYAYHVPVAKGTFLSLGISPSLYKEKIDVPNISVEDPINDAAYQSLLNQGGSFSKIQINTGLALHSEQFYISYSLREMSKIGLTGNDEAFDDKTDRRHHFMAGYTFHLGSKLDLMPNTFLRLSQSRPTLLELGSRLRYNKNMWLALSYRNDKTMVGGLGFLFKNKFQFGYAYEYKSFGISQYARGTHEFVIGMHLFKNKPTVKYKPTVAQVSVPVVAPIPVQEEVKPVEVVKPKPVSLTAVVKSTTGETINEGDLQVKNLTTGQTKRFTNLSNTVIDFERGTDYELATSKEGYITEILKVTASEIAQRNNQLPITIVLKKSGPFKNFQVGESIELDIKYDLGKADVRTDSKAELDKLINLLVENQSLKLEIGAHTDARGSAEANMLLSQKRAEAAVNYLISKGIDKSRLYAKGYGKSNLKVDNAQSEQEHAQNRRTSIKIVEN